MLDWGLLLGGQDGLILIIIPSFPMLFGTFVTSVFVMNNLETVLFENSARLLLGSKSFIMNL